jgi:hypothetical protein
VETCRHQIKADRKRTGGHEPNPVRGETGSVWIECIHQRRLGVLVIGVVLCPFIWVSTPPERFIFPIHSDFSTWMSDILQDLFMEGFHKRAWASTIGEGTSPGAW